MAQYILPELLPEHTNVKVFPAERFGDASGYYVDEITVEKAYGDVGGTFSLAPPDNEALHQISIDEHSFLRRDASAFALRTAGVQPLKINVIYRNHSDDTRRMLGRVMNGLDIASDGVLSDTDLARGIARAFTRNLFLPKPPTPQMLANYEANLTSLYTGDHGADYHDDYHKEPPLRIDDYVKIFLIDGQPESPLLKKLWSSKEFQKRLGAKSRSDLVLGWFMKQHIEDHIRVYGL